MTAEKTSLQCHLCAKEFKYDSERRRHEQSHSPQFRCKVCSKNFSFISALRRHEKQHDRIENVKCDKCGRVFRDHNLLKRHTRYAHGGASSCSKCNTTFSSAPALRLHMKTHKIDSEKKYQCCFAGCNKAFNFPHHLKHHELTHTDSKQHFCGTCGKGFIQYHHLKTHLKSHDPELSLYCTFPDCNKKFATEYARKRHLALHQNKMDSGISSDSNSASDIFASSNCNQGPVSNISDKEVYKDECLDLTVKCGSNYVNQNECNDIPEDLSLGKSKDKSVDNELCKTILGECIMDENDKGCVCSQISENTTEGLDFTPIDSQTAKMNKLNINDIKFQDPCAGCACSDHCNAQNNMLEAEVLPEIEYGTDGAVKIKECFDVDLQSMKMKDDNKLVPFNSCMAVLGTCIVSGNGTIGAGCLCARMALEERVNAQDIEDITPHPTNELYA